MNYIWDNKPAADWNNAYPLGNGFLGAMVFGNTDVERIQLNEDSLWSGGFMERTNPDSYKNLPKIRHLLNEGKVGEAEELASQSMFGTCPHMRHYQTLGDVWIDFLCKEKRQRVLEYNKLKFLVKEKYEVQEYSRELDLDQSIMKIAYSEEGTRYTRECFASNPDSVIVYSLKADGEKSLNFEVFATRKDNRRARGASYCDGCSLEGGNIIRLYGTQGGRDGIGFELAVQVVTEDGNCRGMGSHLIVENAKRAVIYITARTTFRNSNPWEWCKETLKKAVYTPYEELKKTHIADYKKLYEASILNLPSNPECEKKTTRERLEDLRNHKDDIGLINIYYNFSRYLLISASRKGSLPATLQGIWNEEFDPMWGSKYTININIQMNYWMAEKGGLSELHMPLLEHLKSIRERGRKVAADMYGARGFCCHHNTDIWGDCAPQDNNLAATIWPLGGAWLCLHLIQHYRYTKDRNFLKEYYPILCDCVVFFIDYMVQDENHCWITGPSASPENTYKTAEGEYGRLCMGPVMDAEILHELFKGYLEIEEEVGKNQQLREEVLIRYQNQPSLKIGKWGQIQEWNEDFDEMETGHRHISQLFGLYPGTQIQVKDTPKIAAAAERTLRRRLSNGGGHTGWSKAWIILFYARLWKGNDAWQHLCELLAHATLDNLFDNHPPFQIDGNFGGACGLIEMLVQDYGDRVYLLPALPDNLKEGGLKGIRLLNGAVLEMSWSDGKLEEFMVIGLRNTTFTLIYGENSIYLELQNNEKRKILKEELL